MTCIAPCHAILFDLDGVLVDSIASIDLAVKEWTESAGTDFNKLKSTMHSLRDEELISMVANDADLEVEKGKLRELELANVHLVSAQPGAQQLVLEVQEAGIPWAVVTSGQKEVVLARLNAAKLPIPKVLITADDCENGKPDPAPYLLAAQLLNINPKNCIAIEDTPTGARSARASGATTIGITTTVTEAEFADTAHLIISSFDLLTVKQAGIKIGGFQ